ncbi:MAG TPA: PAS domain S-box protein [Puia sp.]|jgi:PAS domain S-box-containing protein|nr:PAS domain S-box protein [Puia sp.]
MQYSNHYKGRVTAAEEKGTNTDSEERYRCLFEQATDLIVIHDMDGNIVNVNDSLFGRLGYSRDEMLRMNMSDLIDPEQLKTTPLRMRELAEGKRIFSERRYVCRDGSFVEIEANVKKMSNNLVMGVARDVTERKKMEREFRAAELMFRTISERSLVGIYIIQDGRFAYVNPKFAEIFGYPPEEMINSYSVEMIVDAEDQDRIREQIRARMEGELTSVHFEAKGRKKDGTLIYAEVFGSRSLYKERVAIMGTLIDITERKVAEEQLLRERNLSNEIIDCLPGVFFLQDADGKYLRWNKHFGRESGYSYDEVGHLNPLDFFQGAQKEEIQRRIRRLLDDPTGETDLEAEITTRDGRKVPFYYKAKRILYEGRPCIIGSGYNISSLRRAQEQLRKSEANLHTILDNTDTTYVLLDKDLNIISYNQRAADFARRELGHHMVISDKFLDYFPMERRDALSKWMTRVITGEKVDYEISYPQPDGTFTWYHVRMFPITSGGQEVWGMMTAVSDITQKKLMELEILNQKVQQQKKITRAVITAQEKERTKIGQELHDNVNQILATSRIYLTTAMASKMAGKENLIPQAIGLIDNAIDELRFLARNEITPQGKLNLKDLIQPLVDALNERSAIRTRFVYRVAVPSIDIDLKLNIYRIIQEQITNILKHAHASSVDILLGSDDGFIHVTVADDGKGFELTDNRKGIGITNMINRIESFNGDYLLDSSPGEGCTLHVRFPF